MTNKTDKWWREFAKNLGALSPPTLKSKDVQNPELFESIRQALAWLSMLVRETTKPLGQIEIIGWADIAKALESNESTVKNWKEDMIKEGVITYRNTGRGKDRPVASYLSLIVYKINRGSGGKAGWDQKLF